MASYTVVPEPLRLEGGAGAIEALLELPAAVGADGGAPVVDPAPRSVALCCHPHPLYGGSLSNKVIHTVARAFVAAGVPALRFNFRGVGASAGVHDDGRGETEDLIAVAGQLRRRFPGADLWLAGFSFGAWISLRATARLVPARLVTVAPPVGRWDFADIAPPTCPWLLLQGTADELLDATEVETWARALSPEAQIMLLPEASHFFHGRLHEVRDLVEAFARQAYIE
jgi:alpha/beta superfamily hydrolase